MKSHRSRFISIHTFVLIFILLPFISIAQIVHTQKIDATFTVNDSARFVVEDTLGGVGGTLSYEIYLDATDNGPNFTPLVKLDSGMVDFPPHDQGYGSITYAYDQPGVISCRVITGLNDQDPIASAAYSPFKIQQLEEEGDFLNFDSFWTAAKNQLALVSMAEVLTEATDTFYESTSYKIKLGNINGRKVHGILTIPKNDGPYGAGPYPAMVQLPPYGDNLFDANANSPNAAEITGIVHLNISIHNTETDVKDPNAYLPKDNLEFADSNYYKQAVLAGVRAIDYLYTRTDIVDTSKVGVMGVSQGGGLAVMVAGIDDRVKYLMASNPASSEHLGEKFGVATGYPKFLHNQRKEKPNATEYKKQEWLRNVKYYDIINFAKRYNGPASIFVGYEDVTCPARGTFAVFNTLKGPKILTHETNQGHNHGVYSNTFPTWIARHLETDAKFAFGAKGYYINLGVDKDIPFGKKVSLEAIVEHDHSDYTANFTYEWSQISGPGKVTLSNPTKKISNATFSQKGQYKLQFKAVDKSQLDSNKYFFTLIDEIEFNVVDTSFCIDVDKDGICASSDCNDNNPLVPDLPGKRCNDYKDNTSVELLQGDNCTCAGGIERITTIACNNDINITHGAGEINLTSLSGQNFFVKVWPGANINLGQENTVFENSSILESTTNIPNLPEGDYVVWIRTTGYATICLLPVYVTLPLNLDNIVEDLDNDNDSIPASQDWNDYDNQISSFNPGAGCDDGDSNTTGDYIRDDGFTCAGNYVDPCPTSGGDADKDGVCDNNDCNPNDPNFPKEINTPCDDGDFNTKNDVYIDGCTCQGVPLDSTNTGGGTNPSNTLWTLSNDGNYIYREGRTVAAEFRAEKLMVEANLSTNNLLEGSNNVMPLEELRGYIEQNKHLPNIPKAATVLNSGLNVGLLSVLRMQKIKELTLYLLEMNERLEEMEKENKGLEKLESEFNDCDNVTVTDNTDGTVTINSIHSDAIITIAGPATGWVDQPVCDGDCSSTKTVPNLTAGDYTLKIQKPDPYCFKQVTVAVTTGGGGTNPCANDGGDTDGDGICDNQDNCDNTQNVNQTDNDGDGIGNICDNCPDNSNADQADNDGDGEGNLCDLTPDGGGSTPTDCNGVTAVDGGLSVIIGNIPSGAKVEITGVTNSWGALQLVCDGNCNTTQTVSNLLEGAHRVTIQTFNPYCYNEIDVTVTTEGSNSGGGNNGGGGTQQDTTTVGLWTANNTEDYIFRDGKVMVMDTFMAEKVIVEVLSFPDYVFDEDYNLMPLNKLQQYITTNKHLPNIPKGKIIEKEGMNIGDISVLQMEKIEELTLYLLEMNERLKQLEQKRK